MEKEKIINEMYRYLVGVGKIQTQQDLADAIGANKSTISAALNGVERSLTKRLLDRINYAFGSIFNDEWLAGKDVEMLKTPSEAQPLTDFPFMNVPIVHIHAHAGYTHGYGDSEYIDSLPTIPVIVDKNYRGKYRVFEIEGDSMDDGSRNSICDGDKVLAREVMQSHWKSKLHFKDWFFIIVMKDDGILAKQIIAHDTENHIITCHSLNYNLFPDFDVNLADVAELYNIIKIVDRSTRI